MRLPPSPVEVLDSSATEGSQLLSSALGRGQIVLPTSFCAESHEVRGLIERPDWGTILYEFYQNQLDAFRLTLIELYESATPLLGEIPEALLPRTWIVRVNAAGEERRELFTGDGTVLYDGDRVARIEITDHGPGLSPEHVLGMRHASGDSAFGKFGRGFKVAGTVLGYHGMQLGLRSHVNGIPWEGHTSLRPLSEFLRLAAAGDMDMRTFLDRLKLDTRYFTLTFGRAATAMMTPQTVVAIENPSTEILRTLAAMPRRFLYLNPEFPGACLVPPSPVAKARGLLQVPVGAGRLIVLSGVPGLVEPSTPSVPLWERDDLAHAGGVPSYDHLYVDGLALPLDGYSHPRSLTPLAVEGLSRQEGEARVSRTSDSRHIEAGDLSYLVASSLRQIEDRNFWEELLAKAVRHPETPCLEFAYVEEEGNFYRKKRPLPPLSPEIAALVRETWNSAHPDSLICHEKDRVPTYSKLFPTRKIIYVSKGLYGFLNTAGVPTVQKSTGEQAFLGMHPRKFRFPSLKDPRALHRIIQDLLYEGGEIALDPASEATARTLRASFPFTFYEPEAFEDVGEEASGKILTRLAAFAHQHGLTLNCFALDEQRVYRIFFRQERAEGDGSIHLGCQIAVFDRNESPELAAFSAGKTYAELTGPVVDALEMSAHGEEFRAALQAFQEKLRGLPFLKKDPRELEQEQLQAAGMGKDELRRHLFMLMRLLGYDVSRLSASLGAPEGEASTTFVSNRGLGEIGKTPESFMAHLRSVEGLILEESRMPPGMYVNGRATHFTHDPLTQRGSWTHPSSRQPVSLTRFQELFEDEDLPSSPRIALNGDVGERNLMMLPRHDIVAFKVVPQNAKAGIQLSINPLTGCYTLRVAPDCPLVRFIYYTAPTNASWQIREPLEEERANPVRDSDLVRARVLALSRLRNIPDLVVRTVQAQQQWGNAYTYTDDPELDAQSLGDHAAQIAAQILNQASGHCLPCASGGVLFDRAAGLASRLLTGYVVHPDGSIGPHASKETWVGQQWIETDPQQYGVGAVQSASKSHARPHMVDTRVAQPAKTTPPRNPPKATVQPAPSQVMTRTRMAFYAVAAVVLGVALGRCSPSEPAPIPSAETAPLTTCPPSTALPR